MGATGGIPNDVGPSHQLHDVHEPIIPRSQDLIEGSEKHPKVRKIAAGPALPHYKGTYEPPRGITNNTVFEQVRHKPACTRTEAG